MSRNDLQVLDTLETADYIKGGDLSDDDLEIPVHMVPPEVEGLESRNVHASYPHGNPTHIKHPAARPRPLYDPDSRALFEDMNFDGAGGIAYAMRWKDMAQSDLLPVDEAKEEENKASQARKMASGTSQNPNPGAQLPSATQDQTLDEDDEDEDEEEEDEDEDDQDGDLDDEEEDSDE